MTIYDPKDVAHSVLIAQWWAITQQNGDLDLMMTKRAHSLAGFFRMFEPPSILVFEHDDDGIWFAGWFEPAFDFAFFSLWVRPDKRGRQALGTLMAVYDMGFKAWPAIMGVTKQEHLLAQHERLGYHVVGKIPKIFDGEDAWLVVLDKEDFYGRRGSEGSEGHLGQRGVGSLHRGAAAAVEASAGRDL